MIGERVLASGNAAQSFHSISSQKPDVLAFWREIATELGIEHDGPEEDDEARECDRCGDEAETLSSRDLCDGCEEEEGEKN